MDVEGWQLLAGVTAIIVIYVVVSRVFGQGASSGLAIVVAAVFGTVGMLLGRYVAKRLQTDRRE